MPNTHLEHPEDLILTGETWVVDAMFSHAESSLKIDGCPAVIWGTHPETGKFFVGTKSVFNKKLIKINYEYSDIIRNHPQENLQRVLSACLSYLPRTEGVFQGDFIGFGGNSQYTPNTLTYDFGTIVTANIIVAPHTQYHIPGAMCNAEASPLTETFTNTPNVLWVQPIVDRMPLKGNRNLGTFACLGKKEAAQAKVAINALIRSGQELDLDTLTDILGSAPLAEAYLAVLALKQQVLDSFIIYNAPKCFLGGERVQGEGFVMNTDKGSFKVIDRKQFSYANFTQGRFQ